MGTTQRQVQRPKDKPDETNKLNLSMAMAIIASKIKMAFTGNPKETQDYISHHISPNAAKKRKRKRQKKASIASKGKNEEGNAMKYKLKKSSGLWTEFLGSLVFKLIEGRFVSMGGSCSFEYETFKNHFYQEVTDAMVEEWFRDMMEIVSDYESMKIKKS